MRINVFRVIAGMLLCGGLYAQQPDSTEVIALKAKVAQLTEQNLRLTGLVQIYGNADYQQAAAASAVAQKVLEERQQSEKALEAKHKEDAEKLKAKAAEVKK